MQPQEKPKSRKKFFAIGLVVLLIAALAVVFLVRNNAREQSKDTGATKWLTQSLDSGSVSRVISASGALNPVNQVQVGTQVSGTVKRILVDFNSQVQKGELLAEIDTTLLEAELASAEAAVAVARSNLGLARQKLDRNQALYEQKFISSAALDEYKAAFASSDASVRQQEANARRIRTNLANAAIRSPVSGIVVSRDVSVGQTVQASFSTPVLFKIAQDLTQMQIDANVTEADVGLMKEGQEVRFTVDAFPDQGFQGVVHQIRNNYNVQQNVVTYTVVIRVQNKELNLRPGMTGYVNVNVAKRDNVLRLPNAALRFTPTASTDNEAVRLPQISAQQRVVWQALPDGNVKPVVIGVGLSDNQFTEVVSNELKVGDAIVVAERPQSKSFGPKIF
jgi:HlyD family secretion protein